MARNDAQTPRQIVLADALIEAIAGRRVKAAVFTTFEFDPAFFELHVLPCLFPEGAWSHMPNVRRLQVGDALRSLPHVAVFYDRRGLKPSGGAARLDYERIALARPRGVFHAKSILLLVEDAKDEAGHGATSLLLLTTSANLTRSGWHENLEVAHVVEIASGDSSAVRDDMLHKRGLLFVLEDAAPGGASQAAIQAIREFLREEAETPSYLKHAGRLRPRLYVGREPVPQFLRDEGRIAKGAYCLEIISPFFENTADARTLKALLDGLSPAETRIYLPLGDDGRALCTDEYFEAVRGLKNVHWARLPDDLTQSSRENDKSKRRHVHAKVYRLFRCGRSRADWREVQLVGSVNLTGAAHAGGPDRNFETGILVELECEHEPDWWMTRLRSTPNAFDPQVSEDDAGTLACHEVTLRFDWQDDVCEYFWKAEAEPPRRADVGASGVVLCKLEDIECDLWRRLPEEAAQAIRGHLLSSSLVELVLAAEQPQPMLVQELNMVCKPSLLDRLTPAEILEYWSLLTPERRNAFLETKLAAFLEPGNGKPPIPPPESPESMFDRFAGILHAFSCLEEHVLEALKRGATKEAKYRLLGESYDSLPALVRGIKQSADKDSVTKFVMLLCAVEVFQRLRKLLRREGVECGFFEENKRLCDSY